MNKRIFVVLAFAVAGCGTNPARPAGPPPEYEGPAAASPAATPAAAAPSTTASATTNTITTPAAAPK